MSRPLPAYSGQDAYIFVSYSHGDRDTVYPEIRRIQDMGFNVWYDEGIDAGDEWTDTLADALAGSSNCMFFVSPKSVESENCRREINFAQHLKIPVTSVHIVKTDLSRGLQLSLGHRQAILMHQLPAERYLEMLEAALQSPQSKDFLQPAPEVTPATLVDDRHAVLVLPFVNRSRNEDVDFFCEGIADEIITALSSVRSLRVISGSAARQIDARNASLGDLKEQLGVRYVLEGSVQYAGNRIRVTARLPHTDTGEVLWADRWDGANDEIFDIQDNISLGILDALKIELGDDQSEQVVARPIPDINAYEYYLRARQSIYRWTDDALKQALDYLQRGEDIIGENSYIISARGYVYWQFHNLGLDPDPKHLEAAQECIDRLFALNSDSPEGHRLKGLVKIMQRDEIGAAIDHLKLALRDNPNDIDTLFWLSQVFGVVGRVSSGLALAERLLKLDPVTPVYQAVPAILSLMDGDAGKASRLFDASLQKEPDNPILGFLYGQSLAMDNRHDEAVSAFERLHERQPESFFALVGNFYARCVRGDGEAAMAEAPEDLFAASRADPQSSWTMAQALALTGKHDDAVDWIENAISLGFWNYPLLAERDATLKTTRQHERYDSLMLSLRDKWIFIDA